MMYGIRNRQSVNVAVIITDLFYACILIARAYTWLKSKLQVF